MNNFLMYIVETSVAFALLYSIYYLTIKRLTFHWLNRILLISFIPLSLLIPTIEIEFNQTTSNEIHIPKFEEFISNNPIETVENNLTHSFLSINKVIFYLYIFGVTFYIISAISNILKLYSLKRSGKIIQWDKYSIISSNFPSVFSFFNWIFIPDINTNKPDLPIIEHEKIHFKFLHTLDLILTELFIAVFWFNPFVYFYRKSIKTTHEYQVDSKVLSNGIKKSHYLQLILNNIGRTKNMVGLYNYFNYLTIKKRVDMITKRKSPKFQLIRYFLFLPVVALMTISSTRTFENNLPDIYPIKKEDFNKVSNDYGVEFKNPITKKINIHSGIDFSAEKGTSIRATADGTIVSASFEDKWGKLIVVDHGNGYNTWYAHLNDFDVKKGDKVNKGQQIGFVGNTGYSTGPHLHYEVRLNNERINPWDFIHEDQ